MNSELLKWKKRCELSAWMMIACAFIGDSHEMREYKRMFDEASRRFRELVDEHWSDYSI